MSSKKVLVSGKCGKEEENKKKTFFTVFKGLSLGKKIKN